MPAELALLEEADRGPLEPDALPSPAPESPAPHPCRTSQGAPDPWAPAVEDGETWSELAAETGGGRALQRRLAAFRWWWSRWLDPGFRRFALLPLNQHFGALVSLAGQAVALAFAFVVLRALAPESMEPGQALWVTCLVWLVASCAGEGLFRLLGVPKALGYLIAGSVLRVLPSAPASAPALDGLNYDWSRTIRAGSMGLVLLRVGLGLNLNTMPGYGPKLLAIATIPSLVESLAGAALANALFGMPFLLAWAMGFMVAAVGPAIVSEGCASVKERGFNPRAPNFLMTAMCFDDIVCIIGFNCALQAFLMDGEPARLRASAASTWGYLTAPLSLALGLAGGVAGALLMSATALWHTPARRVGMLLLVTASLMFSAQSLNQSGAGAIATFTFGLCTRHFWLRGVPGPLLSGPHAAQPAAVATQMLVESHAVLRALWEAVCCPLLFGLLGAAFDLSFKGTATGLSIGSPLNILRSFGYVIAVTVIRLITSVVVTAPMRRLTRTERLFCALAWCSKATTQAAFATIPRYAFRLWIANNPPDARLQGADRLQLIAWGENIMTTCVIAVFVGAPLGTILIHYSAPHLLSRERPPPGKPSPERLKLVAGGGGEEGAASDGDSVNSDDPWSDDDTEWARQPLPSLFGPGQSPAGAVAPAPLHVSVVYDPLPAAEEAAARGALLGAAERLAEVLPGLRVELLLRARRRRAAAKSTFPSAHEDPNVGLEPEEALPQRPWSACAGGRSDDEPGAGGEPGLTRGAALHRVAAA